MCTLDSDDNAVEALLYGCSATTQCKAKPEYNRYERVCNSVRSGDACQNHKIDMGMGVHLKVCDWYPDNDRDTGGGGTGGGGTGGGGTGGGGTGGGGTGGGGTDGGGTGGGGTGGGGEGSRDSDDKRCRGKTVDTDMVCQRFDNKNECTQGPRMLGKVCKWSDSRSAVLAVLM